MATTTRQTAEERREAVLAAALEEFGRAGYHGASTDAIARRRDLAAVPLPPLRIEEDLYLAGVRRCFRRTLETMQGAAEGLRGEEALEAMGQAYGLLSTDPLMLQAQLRPTRRRSTTTTCARPYVRATGLYAYVERVSGASDRRLARFFANGMLLNVIASMGFHEEAEPEPWAYRL